MQVFISRARADMALARKLSEKLKKAGLDVWFDEEQVLPGQNWAAEIAKALQESQVMIVLLTPDSLRSPRVKQEISYALGDEHYADRVIPVFAAPPEQLTQGEIPWILNRFRGISLSNQEKDEEWMERIAEMIKSFEVS